MSGRVGLELTSTLTMADDCNRLVLALCFTVTVSPDGYFRTVMAENVPFADLCNTVCSELIKEYGRVTADSKGVNDERELPFCTVMRQLM